MTDTKTPFVEFEIHILDASGLNIPLASGSTEFAADSETLFPGQSTIITERVFDKTVDREGVSWLTFDAEQQTKAWGRIRFGRGPVPADVAAQVRRERLAGTVAEADALKRLNPSLAKASSAALRLRELEEQIEASKQLEASE